MTSINIIMLQTVANGLGDLRDEMVFVGGAVAELYADNPAASEITPTLDVDCVIEIGSRLQFAKLEENLRTKGFTNDISENAPICRWIYITSISTCNSFASVSSLIQKPKVVLH